jgi:hypothetical protein
MGKRKGSTLGSPAYPAPQLATPRNPDRPTLGGEIARWHLAVNRQHVMPHQQYIADVAGELDELGRRRYELVLLEMPRQNGKTNLVEAAMIHASRRAEPDGNRPRRTVVYCSDKREKARERLVVDLIEAKLERHPRLAGTFQARKSNGSERITWRDTKSRIMLQASNDNAGHSLTIDDAFLDESYAHRDLTLVNGIQPTMITKADPQLWIISTKGDGDDGMLLHYEEVARIALNDPDTRVAVFVWEADEDDDRNDPATWRKVMPALGRTITEARVRTLLTTTAAGEFDRAYLNRRPSVAATAALDVEAWHGCRNDGPALSPTGPVVLAVDVDPNRTHGVLAVAFAHHRGVGVIIDRRPGTGWMVPAVQDLVHRPGLTVYDVWGDRRAGVGGIIDQLQGRGIPTHEVSAGDVASAAGDIYDLVRARELVHDHQLDLDDAVTGSRRRPLGEAWAFSKVDSIADVAPLTAATLAVAGFRHHFPVGLLAAAGHIR